ncbi:MAG: O-antigen ligase family protein [Betaproteobacteria bacterium]|nr:O-antigen ligase family protein [Betaproteobacteria bacterium]
MFPSNIKRIEPYAHNWVVFGFFVYLGAFFILEEKNIIYPFRFFVVLPIALLCIISRFKCVQDKHAVFICLTFLGYLAMTSLWGSGKFWEASRYTFFIICLMLSTAVVSQRFSENSVLKFIIGMGLVTAIFYIVAIFLSGRDLMDFVNLRFNFHEINGWGNNNAIESAAIIGVPVIAAWYFFPGKECHVKLMLITTIILCFVLMFVTKSRGPILSVIMVLFCIVLFRREKSDYLLFFLFFALAGLALLSVNNLGDIIVSRFEVESYRIVIWRGTWELFGDHWLFGQGYRMPTGIMLDAINIPVMAAHAHNTFFEVLRIGGIVGGVLFIFMFCSMVRFSYIHSGNRFYLLWLFFGVLCMATNGRLPLIKPTGIEFFEFWLPVFLFYFSRGDIK